MSRDGRVRWWFVGALAAATSLLAGIEATAAPKSSALQLKDVTSLYVRGDDVFAAGLIVDPKVRSYTVQLGAQKVPMRSVVRVALARWGHRRWAPVGDCLLYGSNMALPEMEIGADASGAVYVAGAMSRLGSAEAHGFAIWNGKAWSTPPLPTADSALFTLTQSGDRLYGGGANFFDAWAEPAVFEGGAWKPVDPKLGLAGSAPVLLPAADGLYMATDALTWKGPANVQPTGGIVRWTGTEWAKLGAGLNGRVDALASGGSVIYLGGKFDGSLAGHPDRVGRDAIVVRSPNVIAWDGKAWSALGSGLDAPVAALAADGADLYALYGDAIQSRHFAAWHDGAWKKLPTHFGNSQWGGDPTYDGRAESLAIGPHHRVLVGGTFDRVDQVVAEGVAVFDPASGKWSDMAHSGI